MKKINSIKFNNFKAFFGEETLKLEGKNLLLYGENGSGKSSIYWGLYTFLQSSGKKSDEIKKYFVNFDETDPDTNESLKNIFCDSAENSFIELETIDENKVTTQHLIKDDFANTNLSSDTTIAVANASSDFIHYKLLYNFYDVSHKYELNLWKVFMRDIFPYFKKHVSDQYYRERIDNILKGVPMSSGGKKVSRIGGRPQTEYVGKIDRLNSDIQLFINEIEQNANNFLREHFCNGQNEIEINLNYQTRINYYSVRWNQKDKYSITLFVKIWDKMLNEWKIIKRPQSFLNEALLTRIAISIRIGALRTRLHTGDYKVLCLDDMLISLDMGNRDKVIQLLLNVENKPTLRFFDEYQKLIFTHDKAFFNLCKQRIKLSGKENEWNFKEIYLDTDVNPQRPFIDNSTTALERAEKHLKTFDYPAAANALRQELEELLVAFLPENEIYVQRPDGSSYIKNLDGLLNAFEKILVTHGQDIMHVNDLFIYKDHLLNPLSHNNIHTPVYKEELKSILAIIPLIKTLNSTTIKEIKFLPTLIKFKDVSSNDGLLYEYIIEIKENILKYRLLDGKEYLNKVSCVVKEIIAQNGTIISCNKSFKNIQEAVKKIAHYLGTSYSDDSAIMSKLDLS